jgi:hypothetical protein
MSSAEVTQTVSLPRYRVANAGSEFSANVLLINT